MEIARELNSGGRSLDSVSLTDVDPPLDPADVYICEKDTDCISVKSGCCGCSMGGSNTSINRKYKAWWDKETNANCEGHMCPAYISHPCPTTGRCVGKKCTL